MSSAIGGFVIEKIGVWNLLLLSSFPVMGYSKEVQELRVSTKNKYEELKAKGIIIEIEEE